MIQAFLLKHWKVVAIGILLVLLWVLFQWGNSQRVRANEAEQGRDAAISITNSISTDLKFYKNKKGDTVVKTVAVGVPESQVKALLKQKDLYWIKKLEAVKPDGSNLLSASTFTSDFSLDGVAAKEVTICDGVKLKWYKYRDAYNEINVLMSDTSKLEIKNRYWLASSIERKKGWFWRLQWSKEKKFRTVSEAVDANLKAKIDSLQTIIVK